MLLKLRPYQTDAVEAAEAAWTGGLRRVAEVMPTGAGKTVVFAHIARRYRQRRPDRRVLVVAHRTELIEQAAAKLEAVGDGRENERIGIVKAQRNDTLAPIIVASVQTLAGLNRRRMLRDIGLIIVDEAHHAAARSYLDILTHYGALDGDGTSVPAGQGAVALGVTATMSRGDEKALGAVWEDIVYQVPIADMIRDGYLVRPKGIHVWVEGFDLSKVKKSRGDYADGALGSALEQSLAPERVAEAYVEHAAGRPAIAFWPTVRTAELAAEALLALGVPAVAISGETPPADRLEALNAFRLGKVDVVCNCMIMTEGTDIPRAEVCIVARPTTHAGLYVQMVGRVLRPEVGKAGALVLDVSGASRKHTLSARVELFGDEDPLAKAEREKADEEEREFDQELTEVFGGEVIDFEDSMVSEGRLTSAEVDLFRGSDSAWLVTHGGTWFLAAGDRYIAIVASRETPGAYDVTAMHRYQRGTGRWVAQGVPDRAYAMAWAEQDVSVAEMLTARRERGWRARRPSDKQRDLARRYGVLVTDQMLAGEVSNRISVEMASMRIDPITQMYGLGVR